MSVNRQQPHVVIFPEDDANRQLVNGFLLDPLIAIHKIRILPVAGGWMRVLEDFLTDEVANMDAYPHELMVLLIDFDGNEQRLNDVKVRIPERLTERVFILGVLTEPEALKRALGKHYEEIGLDMARDCREATDATWGHRLLQHNACEIGRLREQLCPIIFP